MPAPPYIRIFHETFCQETNGLTMEEQGAYLRLLFALWRAGGRIVHDDTLIAKSLPINSNKWYKIKPALMPLLVDEDGYLSSANLAAEYLRSVGDKKANNSSTTSAASPAARGAASGAASHAAPLAAPRAAPRAAPQAQENSPPNLGSEIMMAKQDVGSVLNNGLTRAAARALDQSKSRKEKYKKLRPLEDGGGASCGKLTTNEAVAEFVNRIHAAFEKHQLTPPFDYPVVESWINNGCDLLRHIVPAVETALDRLGQAAPPRSWRYFAREVYTRQKSRKEQNDG